MSFVQEKTKQEIIETLKTENVNLVKEIERLKNVLENIQGDKSKLIKHIAALEYEKSQLENKLNLSISRKAFLNKKYNALFALHKILIEQMD